MSATTRLTLGTAGLACLLASAGISLGANATGTLTFNSFSTGQRIDTEYVGEYGVTISARNTAGGPNVATLYNSGVTTGTDSNLMAPFDRGNLAGKALSKLLIVAANDTDANGDGKIDKPDDAGSGSLVFDFARPVMCFGFDLVNINGITTSSGDKGYSVEFFDGSRKLGEVGFDQFITKNSPFYDSSIAYGVNSANRVQPILATKFAGGTQYTRAVVNLGGAGALDDVNWKDIAPVPEPAGLAFLALGIPAILARRRR
jgi:hypothetical protein